MFEMWFLTVFGLITSSAAICELSLPFAISFKTWISRAESSLLIASAAWGEVAEARIRYSPTAAARIPVNRSWIEESFRR